MFDTFTIRTHPLHKSSLYGEEGFSFLKMLSPDPTGRLLADEFLIWGMATLLLALIYYFWLQVKRDLKRRLLGRKYASLSIRKEPTLDTEVLTLGTSP
ncbi:hypothetical protein NEDG_01598 [Nematocida displodere]|uniref:Uncharacterized protein n=1 Tax=Nematocida displodere TaxID=1805483 RepID=A0A177EGT9_9MICR|nr:hypothetical protein NEDG_01598 [Nematocida displodere]